MKLGKIIESKYRDWRNELSIIQSVELTEDDRESLRVWYSTNICGSRPRDMELRVVIVIDTEKNKLFEVYYEMQAVLNYGGEMGWIQCPKNLIDDSIKKEVENIPNSFKPMTITTDKERDYDGWLTYSRIKRTDVPEGMFAYDLIENTGYNPMYMFAGIRNGIVAVNFGGTFISPKEIMELSAPGSEETIADHDAWDYTF